MLLNEPNVKYLFLENGISFVVATSSKTVRVDHESFNTNGFSTK